MNFIPHFKKFTVKGFLDQKPPMLLDDGLIEKVTKIIINKIVHSPESGKEDVRELLVRISALQKQNELLEKLSLTDPLTGAYNSRFFKQTIEEFAQNNAMNRKPSGRHFLIMLDLDGFKKINDTYGHETGDLTLIHVVQKLNEMTRKTDSVCRIGGDEFLIILKDATEEGAKSKIMSIVNTFNQMSFDTNDKNIPVRASIGWSELKPDEFVNDVVCRIDKLMYDDKEKKKKDEEFNVLDKGHKNQNKN